MASLTHTLLSQIANLSRKNANPACSLLSKGLRGSSGLMPPVKKVRYVQDLFWDKDKGATCIQQKNP